MALRTGPLEWVATVGSRITNTCVSREGRVICGFPRWKDNFDYPPVAELQGENAHALFPTHWTHWSAGTPAHESLVSVHALHLDSADKLWVLDDGCPKLGTPVEGGPKVVCFDLAANRVERVYPLPPPATTTSSILSHLRTDDEHIYVTDAGCGAILVIKKDSGAVAVRLKHHPATQADPTIIPMINGQPYKSAHGKVATLHLSHLELSENGDWVYFAPLFGPRLQRVPRSSLIDPRKPDAALAQEIEFVCDIPPIAGIHAIHGNGFLLCAATDGNILHLDSENRLAPIMEDPRICFPNEGGFSPDNTYFYFPNSGAHLIDRPYEVFRFRLYAQ